MAQRACRVAMPWPWRRRAKPDAAAPHEPCGAPADEAFTGTECLPLGGLSIFSSSAIASTWVAASVGAAAGCMAAGCALRPAGTVALHCGPTGGQPACGQTTTQTVPDGRLRLRLLLRLRPLRYDGSKILGVRQRAHKLWACAMHAVHHTGICITLCKQATQPLRRCAALPLYSRCVAVSLCRCASAHALRRRGAVRPLLLRRPHNAKWPWGRQLPLPPGCECSSHIGDGDLNLHSRVNAAEVERRLGRGGGEPGPGMAPQAVLQSTPAPLGAHHSQYFFTPD